MAYRAAWKRSRRYRRVTLRRTKALGRTCAAGPRLERRRDLAGRFPERSPHRRVPARSAPLLHAALPGAVARFPPAARFEDPPRPEYWPAVWLRTPPGLSAAAFA